MLSEKESLVVLRIQLVSQLAKLPRKTRYDFVDHSLNAHLDLGDRLILDWMGDIDGIKVGSAQSSRLSACRKTKFVCRHGYCWDAPIL